MTDFNPRFHLDSEQDHHDPAIYRLSTREKILVIGAWAAVAAVFFGIIAWRMK